MADQLIIRGAREHNLKDVSLDLPRDSLIVFTGLSGSGKSSLAFDTIFAEGQRRYVESLSAYARQFLGQMDKPDVDFIEGLSPAVSIDQKSTSQQPALDRRHDHRGLRLPPPALRPRRPAALPDLRRAASRGRRRSRSSTGSSRSRRASGSRCSRRSSAAARASTSTCSASCRPRASPGPGSTARPTRSTEPPTLDKQKKHTIEVVVDRLAVKPSRQAPAHRLGRDRARPGRRPGRVRLRRPRREGPRPRAALLRADGLPQRPPASTPTSSSRGRSRSTRRSAPARRATASAPAWRSTPSSSSPTRRRRSARARSRRGPARTSPTTSAGCSTRSARSSGFDLDTPWERARRQGAQKSILDGHPTKVHVRYQNRYGRERSYYTAVRGRASPTSSAGTARPSPTPAASGSRASCARCPCPACEGTRLKPVSLVGHRSAARTSPRSARCRSTRPPTSCATPRADRARAADRRAGAQGDQRAAPLPARRRPRLPLAQPADRARCPAARRSASGWPPRSAPAWSASSTSSTSRRSGCTSATTTG